MAEVGTWRGLVMVEAKQVMERWAMAGGSSRKPRHGVAVAGMAWRMGGVTKMEAYAQWALR